MIKFSCKNCGQRFNVPESHAGKKGKCPKCKGILIIPRAKTTISASNQIESKELKVSSKNSAYDLALLDVSEGGEIQNSVAGGTSEDTEELERESPAEEIEEASRYKLPWLIDVLLYPASVSGAIHLAIFLFLPPLAWAFLRLGPMGLFFIFVPLCVGVYLVLVGYMLYYICLCIFDSAKGGRRAPDITTLDIPGAGELISQLFLILGAIAICFWPAGLYYVFTKKGDLVFWVLSTCGIFFFPMALLAGVLFDATHALNPVSIIGSISRTFLPYCGLVPLFCVLGGLLAVIASSIFSLPSTQTLQQGIAQIMLVLNRLFHVSFTYPGMAFIYLAMVAAHLLGRFYWWHKDKLGWGI